MTFRRIAVFNAQEQLREEASFISATNVGLDGDFVTITD